jgi:hypothetical protein
MVRAETRTKKNPPTFQHLPASRAKKLKKTWVDTKKIKSKWKAEKRKEGLVGGSTSIEERQSGDIREEGSSDNSNEEVDDGHGEHIPTLSKRPPTRPPRKDSRTEHIPEAQKEDSLRNMTREAYSQSSLHTYKSDPLRRSRGSGGGSQRGCGVRGTNSSARGVGRGRGQPNMKLRMGAMLEKIKRDYA